MEQQPTVLVVDDLPLFRQAVTQAVIKAGARVVGEAGDGRQGLYRYVDLAPDIVFLDIMMPNMDGIACLRLIKRYDPAARVVMCSSVKDSDLIFQAIQLGALDFVPKPFSEKRIAEAVNRAGRATGSHG